MIHFFSKAVFVQLTMSMRQTSLLNRFPSVIVSRIDGLIVEGMQHLKEFFCLVLFSVFFFSKWRINYENDFDLEDRAYHQSF